MKRIEYSSEAGINKELALCYTIPDTFEENKQCYIGVNRNKKMFFTLFKIIFLQNKSKHISNQRCIIFKNDHNLSII